MPIDNRRSNLLCARRAVELAKQFCGKLVFFFASRELIGDARESCPADVRANLDAAEAMARQEDVQSETVLAKSAFDDGILEYAAVHSVDLIIMRSFSEFTFAGSVLLGDQASGSTTSREGLFFGDAASTVHSQCQQNFLYCERLRTDESE